MKVKAKHWLNAGGTWHKKGDVFETESLAGISNAVEVIPEPESVKVDKPEKVVREPKEKPEEKPVQASVKRRGSRK